jgi:hypothetical protein
MSTTTQTQPVEAYELEPERHSSHTQHDQRSNSSQTAVDAPEGTGLDRSTLMKLFSAGFAFFVAGINDGSIGALIPYIIRGYGINTAIVSSTCVLPR